MRQQSFLVEEEAKGVAVKRTTQYLKMSRTFEKVEDGMRAT